MLKAIAMQTEADAARSRHSVIGPGDREESDGS